MFTEQQLISQLFAMGVPQDKPVVMHTSLKAVGETEGRAQGFLDTVARYVTENGGLLLIPTHTWHNFFDRKPVTLTISSNDVCIGTLPKIASVHPNAYRSPHPTHSVAVFGDKEKAMEFTKNDRFVSTMADPIGSMGQLLREDGCILLVGVGQDRNTYLHTVEEILKIENRVDPAKTPVAIRYKNGVTVERCINGMKAEGIGDVSARYPKLEPAFRKYNGITDGFLGNAKVQLCSARILYETCCLIAKRAKGEELLNDDLPLKKEYYE